MMHDAQYFQKLDDCQVKCVLCPTECKLKPGKRGICDSRYNDNGILKTDNFGQTVSVSIDPIEKKPLYHFFPAGKIVSIGPNGCNLSCSHCQNWQISQEKVNTDYIPPEKLAEIGSHNDSIGVAYTYTEPIIWFEYIMAAAPLLKNANMVNVMVSNGYINPEPLKELLPHIDAFNIDIKSIRPEFYKIICKGKLDPVLDTIRMIADSKAHLELTYLVIPELNDDEDDFHKLGKFIESVDANIPLHISAYHPSYKLNKPPTPPSTLKTAFTILKQYLPYVYVGNVHIEGTNDTICRSCGKTLIERQGYFIKIKGLTADGKCGNCNLASGIRMK